ncbi:MAG: class I SAM-dependent methyltransferase [Bacteroidota bacterium]|nr:class I SAM-dependent methyltransferase [Bacteroidota bacterium]
MGWYKQWFGTPWYALLYGHRDEFEAKVWVEAILAEWQLPAGSKVLDLACGRGRHARWLSEAGMLVTGIDISPESIAFAQRSVPAARFCVHDMREPFADQEFDAICCLFTSLGYFDSIEDDQKVFASALGALRPGGLFVLDFMNTAVVLSELVPHEDITIEGVDFHIDRTIQQGAIVKQISVNEGGEVHEFQEKVQALMPDQLEAMALQAGFKIMARTDGPDTSLFDPFLSKRFVLWMKRPVE